MADASLNNTEDDVNGTYRTSNGLPWALGLIWSDGNFEIPMEQVDFLEAYPEYALYINSNASTNTDWYKRPAANKTIDLLGL